VSVDKKEISQEKSSKSIREEDEKIILSTPSCKSVSNKELSELRDLVRETLHPLADKTENMIVSQNTVNNQIEFWNNLNNAKCESNQASQSNFENELPNYINYSMYPNATQENSDFYDIGVNPFFENNNECNRDLNYNSSEEEKVIPARLNDSASKIKQEINKNIEEDLVRNAGEISVRKQTDDLEREEDIFYKNEKVLNSPFNSFKIKSNEDVRESIDNMKISNDSNVENFHRECSKFVEDDEKIERTANIFESEIGNCSEKKIEDENLDRIGELQSQNECLENNNTIINSNCIKEHSNLNLSVHSNTSHSRSRSHRRSKYHSMITEEFPSDLVEGSIRTFNQSFSGLESIPKSERFPSSNKFREEN